MEDHEGFCFALLKITSQDNVDLASRQLAAIQLKNIVKRRWNRSAACQRKGIPAIPESERREIMAYVYECVVRCAHAGDMLHAVPFSRLPRAPPVSEKQKKRSYCSATW
jgi:hypothetical protein